jgi:hypothetical protein
MAKGFSNLVSQSSSKCYQDGKEIDCAQMKANIKSGIEKTGSAILTGVVYGFIVTVLIFTFAVISAIGAGKLAYQRSQSMIISTIAFVLSPLYYIYYAFTQPRV